MPADTAVVPPPAAAERPDGWWAAISARPWFPIARRVVGIGFVVFLLALLGNLARQFDWPQALASLRALPASTLLAAAALAATSYALFASFDLVGRGQTGTTLARWRVMAVAFIAYAFNLNVGTLVGGIALRVRLYTQRGLPGDAIARILALSLVTNWLGYFFVAGIVLSLAPPPLPAEWGVTDGGLQVGGWILLALVLLYLAACFGLRKREWHWRYYSFVLPSGPVALLQLAQGATNWMLVAGVAWVLLRQQVAYADVLGTLLVAAVAGVMAHIPAGLGVLEGVFIALLSDQVPQAELLAALLAYRAVYYLMPLVVAGTSLVVIEARTRRAEAAAAAA